jgi:hypothetical protein
MLVFPDLINLVGGGKLCKAQEPQISLCKAKTNLLNAISPMANCLDAKKAC